MKNPWDGFCDIVVQQQPALTVSYRSANFVFEEGLRDGRWVSLSYNAAGYLMAANPVPSPSYMDVDQFPAPQSFDLALDGQSLCSHFVCEGVDVQRGEGVVSGRVTLRHTMRPVKVHICTRLDGTAVLQRWLEIENTADVPAAMSVCAPLAGGVQVFNAAMFQLSEKTGLYRLGYFADSFACHEGNFVWRELGTEITTIAGRYRRDRHRHPMFVLENRLTGECFIGQFGWSGGYAFTFDLRNENDNRTALSMRVEMDSPAPIRVLETGERWASPAVHLGAVFGGLDNAVNAMHRHLRKSVLHPSVRGRHAWIQGAIGPEYDMSLESTLQAIDFAHTVGAELFWVDAGWYLDADEPLTEWWNRCGDWEVSRSRYPNGIGEVRERCHALGLLFGMWMDVERIGPGSKVFHEHPEWIEKTYKGAPNGAGLLDLGNPEVEAWMEEQIARVITDCQVDLYRLDWNVGYLDALGARENGAYLENTYARHQQAVYRVYARLRARFPDVVFENCAGGGGRTDLGMLEHFTHSWVTDWQLHPNAFRITNGMTMALPPECIDRLVGGQNAYLTGDLQLQLRNQLFAHMSIGGIKPNEAMANPRQIALIQHNVRLYKEFVRPILPDSNIYHHTPELSGNYAKGYGILELDASDGLKGVLGVFRLSSPAEPEATVRLRGVDIGRSYNVTFDNSGSVCVMRGETLVNEGLHIRLDGALTSELVLYEAL